MEYLAKYWLNKQQYLAVLDKCLAIVTTDENGKPIRWEIFGDRAEDNGKLEREHFKTVFGTYHQ